MTSIMSKKEREYHEFCDEIEEIFRRFKDTLKEKDVPYLTVMTGDDSVPLEFAASVISSLMVYRYLMARLQLFILESYRDRLIRMMMLITNTSNTVALEFGEQIVPIMIEHYKNDGARQYLPPLDQETQAECDRFVQTGELMSSKTVSNDSGTQTLAKIVEETHTKI